MIPQESGSKERHRFEQIQKYNRAYRKNFTRAFRNVLTLTAGTQKTGPNRVEGMERKKRIGIVQNLQVGITVVGLAGIFGFIIWLLVFFCSSKAHSESSLNSAKIRLDFTRSLNHPNTKRVGAFPSDALLLPGHWKKNPGRFQSLPLRERWWNSQITFNTDTEFFINESRDSLLFPPNRGNEISYLEYTRDCTGSMLDFSYGFLGDRPMGKPKGKLTIKVNGEIVREILPNDKDWEEWEHIQMDWTRFGDCKTISWTWDSESTWLVVGSPLLWESLKSEQERPNLILIVIDSFRKDFMPDYGFAYPITPFLSEFSKESIRFENPFSNGNWTKPSMISFFHSEYASNLGIHNLWFATLPEHKKIFYNQEKTPSLTEVFRRMGYLTHSVMNNVFFLDYTTVGVDLGFHTVFQVGKDIEDTDILTKEAIGFVTENSDKNFFLHLNWNTPHGGYAPPPQKLQEVRKILGEDGIKKYPAPVIRYMGELFYTDSEFGKFIRTLKKNNLYDKSLIVVTGDHGELFDPKHNSHFRYILQGLYGHGETHYDEEINVPYWIKLPKSWQTKQKRSLIPGQSSLLSLVPTILGLWKEMVQETEKLLPEMKNFAYRGVDYSECILKNTTCPSEKFIYTEGRMSESVRTEDYKYIRRYRGYTKIVIERETNSELVSGPPDSSQEPQANLKSDSRTQVPEELYDLKSDPKEYKNLALPEYAKIPEHQALLNRARQDWRDGKFLRKNSIWVRIPGCLPNCKVDFTLYIPSGIYRIHTDERDWIQPEENSKLVRFAGFQSKETKWIQIETVTPQLGFSLTFRRDGKEVPVRIGKWGIASTVYSPIKEPELGVSSREPVGIRKSESVWVYNDGKLSGDSESELQSAMGKEVRKILESWGYIHE
jgi:arylsulfatase A-like enzyme/nitrate reductase NapE component